MQKLKVLYFTAVSLASPNDGGALCCRNHVRRLSDDPSIDLTVAVVGPPDSEEGNRGFVESLGAPFVFVSARRPHDAAAKRRGLGLLPRIYPILLERAAHAAPHVDGEIRALIGDRHPDVVLVDYQPSAHYVPSLFSSTVPRCVITLNREVDFQRDLWMNASRLPGSRLHARVAGSRAARFERWLHARIDGLVALTEHDLPVDPPPNLTTTVIPPFFDPREPQWCRGSDRSVFFVGNVGHFPNRVAVEWICTRLAPEIEALARGIRFRLIGAERSQVPGAWRRSSVDFLGRADGDEVKRQFTGSDLFIAPIANSYGSKMKLLECTSYSTPFVATRTAMSGLPFIQGVPEIDLDRPDRAATTIADLIDHPARLVALSRSIREQLDTFRASQVGIWSRTLDAIVRRSAEQGRNASV